MCVGSAKEIKIKQSTHLNHYMNLVFKCLISEKKG